MAIAVVKRGDKILLRKTDPAKNPYKEPWALFGGRLDGDGTVGELLNRELSERWHMTVTIVERSAWDEDEKRDHDGVTKRFVYLDALCELASANEPYPENPSEELSWVALDKLSTYELNPPTATVLRKLGYI